MSQPQRPQPPPSHQATAHTQGMSDEIARIQSDVARDVAEAQQFFNDVFANLPPRPKPKPPAAPINFSLNPPSSPSLPVPPNQSPTAPPAKTMQVQSSDGVSTYTVTAYAPDRMTCTCPAGKYNKPCRHIRETRSIFYGRL